MEESAPLTLSPLEARILGSLCEKEATTPEYYPLSLNSLVNACNQKSNRHPIMALDEEAVSAGLDALRQKHLVLVVSASGSHVPKYRHSLEKAIPLTDQERSILTELLLRGPQTAGELRTRCERMSPLGSVDDARTLLEEMGSSRVPLVRRLPRQPGRKDSRYAQTLSPLLEEPESDGSAQPLKVEVAAALSPEAETRLAELEAVVAKLQEEFAAFKAQFE